MEPHGSRSTSAPRSPQPLSWILPIGIVGFVLLAGVLPVLLGSLGSGPAVTPPGARTPVQHVVEIMMENHGFDNLFGTFPGAIGFPPNASVPNGSGGSVHPYWIEGNSTVDLPHDRGSELADLDGGRMDGFVESMERFDPAHPNTPMGFYNSTQVPELWGLARDYVLCDMYFAPVLGPTIPNRLYALAGDSAGITSDSWPNGGVALRTIFDQLSSVGLSWTYYYVPSSYAPIPLQVYPLRTIPSEARDVVPVSGFENALKEGQLANVTFFDPSASSIFSMHPPQSVTVGEQWALSIVRAIQASPFWNSTAIFLTFDEGGGFYDSVVPPVVDPLGDGFRVPMLVISPFTQHGGIDSEVFDHTSVLHFIDDNWGLPALNARVAKANDIGSTLHFGPPSARGSMHGVSTLPPGHALRAWLASAPAMGMVGDRLGGSAPPRPRRPRPRSPLRESPTKGPTGRGIPARRRPTPRCRSGGARREGREHPRALRTP